MSASTTGFCQSEVGGPHRNDRSMNTCSCIRVKPRSSADIGPRTVMTRPVGILRRLSDQLAQKLAGARRQVMAEPVVGPDAVLLAVDQARLLEPGPVVRDRRLAQLEVRGEVADADRRFRLPEGRDYRQPSWIGKRFHEAGRLLRPPDVDRRQHAALATLAEDGKLLERHRSDDTQPIDNRRCLVLACNPSTFIDGPKEITA